MRLNKIAGIQFSSSLDMKQTVKKKKMERRQINIQDSSEVEYWSARFGCSKEKLIDAVNKAGTSPIKVARELEK